MVRHSFFLLILFFSAVISSPAQIRILFDATKAETAANADWTIDADKYNVGFGTGVPTIGGTGTEANPQRYPTPAQNGITMSTPENYWSGALSAWGIECVKKGYAVETLPIGGKITYNDSSNPQDLSQYKIVVFCEPNIAFTAAEKIAIIRFVENGGSLLLIADHDMSDRNFDGIDSPSIFNDLMNNNGLKSNPFGILFNLDDLSQTTTNVISSPSNPIINGPYGSVVKIKTSGGCSMTINNSANPNVQGIIFKTNTQKLNNEVLAAMSQYTKGKVFAIGDSSLPDDGSGDPNDKLYNGWLSDADGNHRKLIMNATIWLATVQPDSIKASVKTLKDNICSGSNDGSVELAVSGGNGNYSYLWSNGATTNPVLELPAGTYQVTINSTGVPPLVLKSLKVSAPQQLLAEINVTELLTCKTTSVELLINVNGGTSPYTYQWSSGSPKISAPGTYAVTVTDKNGCKATATTIAKQDVGLPSVQVQSGQITCANPRAFLSASSQNQQIIYEWKGPQNFISGKKDTATILAGTYTLLATDIANGCSVEKKVTIQENNGNPPLSITVLNKRDASDIPSGFISIEVKNGTPPYRYLWKDEQGKTIGSNASTIYDIDKGTYTCEVTDSSGCRISITASISKLLTSYNVASVNSFRLYPNPVHDLLITESEEGIPCSIFDINGKKMMDGNTCQRWDLGHFPAGPYLIKTADASAVILFFFKI